jgi:hypothetical protein
VLSDLDSTSHTPHSNQFESCTLAALPPLPCRPNGTATYSTTLIGLGGILCVRSGTSPAASIAVRKAMNPEHSNIHPWLSLFFLAKLLTNRSRERACVCASAKGEQVICAFTARLCKVKSRYATAPMKRPRWLVQGASSVRRAMFRKI